MAYKLTLTLTDVRTIRFVAARGYAEQVWEALSVAMPEQCSQADDEATRSPADALMFTFEIPEHMAWEIAEEERNNGGHGFGPVSDELTAKLYALIDSIV